jgi:hypothetical protein
MSIVQTVKGILYGGFVSLPMVLIGIVVFLATTLGNLGLIMLTLGHVFLVPFIVFFANLLHEYFFKDSPYFKVPSSDIGQLVPSAVLTTSQTFVGPSYWMAHVTFFFTFLLTNAAKLYSKESPANADPNKVENRKAQTLTAMVLTVVTFVLVAGVRYFFTGTETAVGILFALLLIAPVGYGWYELATVCGARDADIFGILQKILPPEFKDEPPMTCVYSP